MKSKIAFCLLCIVIGISIIGIATLVIKERENVVQKQVDYAYKIGVKAGKVNADHYTIPYTQYYDQDNYASWFDGWCDGKKIWRDKLDAEIKQIKLLQSRLKMVEKIKEQKE